MGRHWLIALTLVVAALASHGEQDASTPSSPQSNTTGRDPGMFIVGPGVSAPELLPAAPLVIEEESCKKKLGGKAVLSFLVDATGSPRNIAFEEGAGGGLDEIAYKMVSSDRFKPALHQNSPVIVPMKDEVELQACLPKKKGGPADIQSATALSSQPKQKLMAMTLSEEQLEFSSFPTSSRGPVEPFTKTKEIKDSVSAPVPLNIVEAVFSDEARKKKVSGVCLISLVVDTDGMPRNVRVIRPLGYGLDEKAVEAARKYRFKPAMRKGTPVPVLITVEVNFRLY
jgi:TonB family protein